MNPTNRKWILLTALLLLLTESPTNGSAASPSFSKSAVRPRNLGSHDSVDAELTKEDDADDSQSRQSSLLEQRQPHPPSITSTSNPENENSLPLVEKESWRVDLPSRLQSLRTLRRFVIDGTCEVYLLGTSHVSRSSCDDADSLMSHVDPDCLFLELCPQRIPILTPPPPILDSDSSSKEDSVMAQIRSVQNETGMTYSSAMSSVLFGKLQADYAKKLGVQVGAEFRSAYDACQRMRAGSGSEGCRVVLGDRPVRLTLVRAWESLSFYYKVKLILALLWSSIRQPNEKEIEEWMRSIMEDEDLLSKSIKEMGRHFPTLGEVIISERDRYMYGKLRQVAGLGAKRIVAVVGAGHTPGICQLVCDDNSDVQEILRSTVETKKWKVDGNEEMMSLVNDVIELHPNPTD